MTWQAAALTFAGLVAIMHWYRWARKRSAMSGRWLNEQERKDIRGSTEFEGVNWKWPVPPSDERKARR